MLGSRQLQSDFLDSHLGIFNWRNLKRVDLVLLILSLALAIIGLMTLYSASVSVTSGTPYWMKQLPFMIAGFALALAITCVDYRFLVSLAPVGYVISLLLLIYVLWKGDDAKGAQRWLEVFGVRLGQPSEFAKVAFVFGMAWYLALLQERVQKLRYFALAFVIAGIPSLLILKQPNLGTALTFVPVVCVMLFAAGCKRWQLITLIILGISGVTVAMLAAMEIIDVPLPLEEHQKKRLITFVNPEEDPRGAGWQTIQTKIAVGSGRMWGKGFMEGTQTHLRYLPEHHTDFIFSLLAEERGFVGAMVVIGLFGALLLRALSLAKDCQDVEGMLLIVGSATVLGFHVFVNIAITIGIMPVTGLPLPFLSYGLSFYLATMVFIGTIFSVRARQKGYFE